MAGPTQGSGYRVQGAGDRTHRTGNPEPRTRNPASTLPRWLSTGGAIAALLWLLLALVTPGGAAGGASHVVVVSFDGLRPDAIAPAGARHLLGLIRDGASTMRARTVLPSVTLVSHASMLTGVSPKRHGLTWNDYKPERGYARSPTIFEFASDAGLSTALIGAKKKLRHLARPGSVSHYSVPSFRAAPVAQTAAACWTKRRPRLMFVHFADPDTAGHASGWMSAAQLRAIRTADQAFGKFLGAIDRSGLRGRTLLLVTADHGGAGKRHGSDKPHDVLIPWIAHGPGARRGYRITGPVKTVDTAATALWALGVPVPGDWDGRPVLEAFE